MTLRIVMAALLAGGMLLGAATGVLAQVAEYGEPVPALSWVDAAVRDYTQTYPRTQIVVGIHHDRCTVYQRGFGVPENTPMRLASVEKPITAAIIRDLVEERGISLSDFVFDLGQPGGGILDIQPANALGDPRTREITVEHLLQHQGGWLRQVSGDPVFETRQIADALGVSHPPMRVDIVRYVLDRPLDFAPGQADEGVDSYSNFGYVVLGLVIEELTGASVAANARLRILTPADWVPATDVYAGASVPAPREPSYLDSSSNQGGDWHHESLQGAGNLVSSAAPLLKFLDARIAGGVESLGMRRSDVPLTGVQGFEGGLPGTRTLVVQRSDGVNIVMLAKVNEEEHPSGGLGPLAASLYARLDDTASPISWPTRCVDGFWVEFGTAGSIHGSYDHPFGSIAEMLDRTSDGSKVQLRLGQTSWTGVLSKRLMLTAPQGPVNIGAQ